MLLLKSINLEIQYCVHLITRDHTSYDSFAIASIQQSTTLQVSTIRMWRVQFR